MTQMTEQIKPDIELATGSGQATVGSRLGGAENPSKIVQKKGLQVFEEMEQKDAHYASVLQTRKLALLGKGYEIQPASDSPRHQEQAAFVRWNLEQMRGSFVQDLYEILDALGKGFSITEIVYTLAERGPYRGKVILKALKAKDQSFFGFDLDAFDNILEDGILQNPAVSHGMRLANVLSDQALRALSGAQSDGINRRLPREKFIHFTFNSRAENPYGRGLGALCYWYSWFKSEGGFKFWLVFLEKFGSPTAKLKITESASDADKLKVRQILRALQQETGVVLPEGLELDFLEAARGGEAGYQALIETCNGEISKAVLGQTLTTEQGSPGSLALGQVHQETLWQILGFDADLLQACINEQLIPRLVDFNWLDVDAYPLFTIPLKPRKDLAVESQSLAALVNLGARIPERYIHENLGLPVAQDDEPILTPQAVPAPPGDFQPFAERPLSRAKLAPPSWARRAQEEQDALVEAGVSQAGPAVAQILSRIIDQVRQSKAIENRLYNVELKLNIQPLRDAMLRAGVLASLTGQQAAVDELAYKGVEFSRDRFETFAEADLVTLDEAAALFKDRLPINKAQFSRLTANLKRKYFTVAGIEEGNLLKAAQEALIEAIDTGGTVETFAKALRDKGVKYTGTAFGADLAGQEISDSHLRTVFRTNALSAYNEGRREIFEDPEVEDLVVAYLYSAIDDDRARPSHAAMDGKIFLKDDPIWQTWWPPNGYNCRCTVVPITQDEARRLRPDQIATAAPALGGEAVKPDRGFGGS